MFWETFRFNSIWLFLPKIINTCLFSKHRDERNIDTS